MNWKKIAPWNILLADDHALFCDAMTEWLKCLSDITTVEYARSAFETKQLLRKKHSFNLLLLDLHMPDMDGVSTVQEISRLAKPAYTAILSADDSPATINACFRTNISGYILKSSDSETVCKAIQTIMMGKRCFPDKINFKDENRWSDKQLQLLTCLAQGMTNKEIASNIFLSEGTVKQYVSSILTKLRVNNRTQASIKARAILGLSSNQ